MFIETVAILVALALIGILVILRGHPIQNHSGPLARNRNGRRRSE